MCKTCLWITANTAGSEIVEWLYKVKPLNRGAFISLSRAPSNPTSARANTAGYYKLRFITADLPPKFESINPPTDI